MGMNPNVSLVIEVEVMTEIVAVDGETMEETGPMDCRLWWRQ